MAPHPEIPESLEVLVGPHPCVAHSSLASQAMKEILLAGDTNRLVAELTFAACLTLSTWGSGGRSDNDWFKTHAPSLNLKLKPLSHIVKRESRCASMTWQRRLSLV